MTVCTPPTVAQSVQHVLVKVDAAGTITCLPEVLNVSGADVLIAFRLDGTNWVFPDTGAVIVSAGGTQFPIPSWTINPKLAALLDCDTSTGDFSYTVQVQHTSTGRRVRHDPQIRNET